MPSTVDFPQTKPDRTTRRRSADGAERVRRPEDACVVPQTIRRRRESEERDFAGIGRNAVAEEYVVRFGMVIDADDELRVRCGVRSMVAENAGAIADLGDFQIVAVDEQTQTHLGRVRLFRQLNHG